VVVLVVSLVLTPLQVREQQIKVLLVAIITTLVNTLAVAVVVLGQWGQTALVELVATVVLV
tara:strand:- start:191 stop:373 length:183 start_codon:yes stop_codon:yes gene_type:complete